MTVISKTDADAARAKLKAASPEEKRALAKDYDDAMQAIRRDYPTIKIVVPR